MSPQDYRDRRAATPHTTGAPGPVDAYRVEVCADPGLCARLVAQLVTAPHGPEAGTRYEFTVQDRPIPLRRDGSLDLETSRAWPRDAAVDFRVIVTEIPRRAGAVPKLAAVHFADGLVIVSLPALGCAGLRTKLRRVVLDSLDALVAGHLDDHGLRRVRFGRVHAQHDDHGPSAFIASPWWWPGRLRLVAGMVRTNRPLRDVPRLKGVWAAAAATGAFGIFYSSIWQMANALPPWRLAVITGLAVTAMVFWLILSNRLWEPSRRIGSRVEAAMYNASTVATLVVCVAVIYAILYVGILLAGLVVIERGFMAGQLGTGVGLADYARIAWLSASMGTIAGAMGANFDDAHDIRNLTHGQRDAQRFPQD